MDLLTTKIVTMSILGLVSLLVGFIPMLVAKKVDCDKMKSYATPLKWKVDYLN